MNSTENKCIVFYICCCFALAVAPLNSNAAADHDQSNSFQRTTDQELVVQAKVVAMRGGCNAVKCPAIQYKLATTKVVENDISPDAPASEVSVLRVCGPSGLTLGGHYQFVLRTDTGAFKGNLDRPIAEGGDYLQCDFVFTKLEVREAPIKYWNEARSLVEGAEQRFGVLRRTKGVDPSPLPVWKAGSKGSKGVRFIYRSKGVRFIYPCLINEPDPFIPLSVSGPLYPINEPDPLSTTPLSSVMPIVDAE